jgi:hypothetical protein
VQIKESKKNSGQQHVELSDLLVVSFQPFGMSREAQSYGQRNFTVDIHKAMIWSCENVVKGLQLQAFAGD